MEIKPVKDIKTPKYPLRDEMGADALKQQIPKRWAGSAAAKVALGTLAAMTLAGCVPDIPTAGVPEPPSAKTEESVTPAITEYRTEGIVAAPTVNVAPMFLHGEGRGAFGCVMVAPPVFLSEEDALAVINETAKEYGLSFKAGAGPIMEGVAQPATNIYGEEKTASGKTMSLQPDFADEERGIVIEFVSTEDVKKWHTDTGYIVSVESYDTKDAADQLSDGLEQANVNNGYYTAGVLYDPCELYHPEDLSDEDDWNKAEAKTKQMSKEQLEKQATDFFEWLKDQGII